MSRPAHLFLRLILTAVLLGTLVSSNKSFAASKDDLVDRIILKNGAVIQGRVIEEKKEGGRSILVVKLKSGGTISLDRAKLVDKVRTYDDLDANYARKLATVTNDPAAYWQILKWCEEQPSGKSRFKNERQFLLEKIIALDPNDKDARRRLGYRLENGQWVLESAWFEEYGYKKKDGRTWQSDLGSSFSTRNANLEEQKKEKRAEIDAWFRRFEKSRTTLEDARLEIIRMADETTVAILLQRINDADKAKKELPLRRIFMEAFGRVPNRDSIKALSYLAVNDSDAGVRDRALTMLLQPGFDRDWAASFMAGHLHVDNDEFRERSAYAIGELGAMGFFMSLVGALENERMVIVNPDAGRTNITAGPGGVGMQAPSAPIKEKRIIRSDAAHNALKKLAKVDYGFNKELWQAWYIRNYTLYDTQVRTDD